MLSAKLTVGFTQKRDLRLNLIRVSYIRNAISWSENQVTPTLKVLSERLLNEEHFVRTFNQKKKLFFEKLQELPVATFR